MYELRKQGSFGGCHYLLTFIDDFSRKVWCYFIKHKDTVYGVFLDWKKLIEKKISRSIKILRTDNGLEFVDGKFLQYCSEEGIVQHN